MRKLRALFIILGLFSLANGVWMLVAAESWYTNLPAGVMDTGPYNGHFIRDIGLVYSLSGAGFVWAAFRLRECRALMVGQAVFYGGHAVLHVLDILMGRLGHSHWTLDMAGVFLPGMVITFLVLPPVWRVVVSVESFSLSEQ